MRIAVDAGHGSNTPGKRSAPLLFDLDVYGDGSLIIKKGDQLKEHIANVGVSNYIVQALKRCGFDTFKTGFDDDNPHDDEDTSLSARQRAIAKANCDISVSVHFNAHGDGKSFTSANGVEVYIHSSKACGSKRLAEDVLKELTKGVPQKNRGVKTNTYAMCNCNELDVKAAILLELAFMTHLDEVILFGSAKYWKESAEEVVHGICKNLGLKYVPEVTKITKINQSSNKEDIQCLQKKLNHILKINRYPEIKVTSLYDNATRIAVLIAWELWGWNKDGTGDGWSAGSKTLVKLEI